MKTNTAKAKLKAGGTLFGCFVRYPQASLIEVLGYYPWDFLLADAEHGTIQPADLENMVRAAELRNITSMVRVTTNQPSIILRFMDTGVLGLHVTWVNSAAEAEAAVRSVKYHPRGIRGLAGVRASDYAQSISMSDYVQQANAETMVVLQIETADAIDALPEIVKISDIDVVFIGPMDLSQSLGFPGQPQHPTVQAGMQRIIDTVVGTDKALGIMVTNAAAAKEWQQRGARYIAVGLESLLGPAARDYLKAARE